MFNQSFTTPRAWSMRLALTISLVTCLVLLSVWHFRGVRPDAFSPAEGATERAAQSEGSGDGVKQSALAKLEGEAARAYLEKTSGGQSLMRALTAERFGLKLKEQSPFDKKSGAGYLAMSHDQNLNAWFDEGGITVRPTLSEEELDRAWQLGFRLKSYGYGSQLTAAAPVVSHRVKENRIEYERGVDETGARVVEWYENQSAGIEQGFTLSARPAVRGARVGKDESLRLVMAVTGDLRARVKDEGQSIELSKQSGEGVLSYSKLVAFDTDGKQLAAWMEASTDGREIALVVDDKEAAYPLVIDPITATLEKKLDAAGNRQTDARFGFAVAIDVDTAVVGAWREDVPFTALVDAGAVYTFTRSGSVWSSATLLYVGTDANGSCGWSVALNSATNRVAFGCPGANLQTGRAFLQQLSPLVSNEIIEPAGFKAAGDQFGYSVALSNDTLLVGAPFDDFGATDTGTVLTYRVNSDNSVSAFSAIYGSFYGANAQFGTSVAIDGDFAGIGAPGAGPGTAAVFHELNFERTLQANDGQAGDNFGNGVAISGTTVVVGAWGDDDRATDAGAAYVFVRNTTGDWLQQQKLTAADGRAGDHFSENAVAIEGNTIVVGANAWDLEVSGDNAGAAYIFTRSGTVWSLQTGLNGGAADNFGVDVDISGNTVIIGSRADDASGTARAGAAYVYRLDCVPPYIVEALIVIGAPSFSKNHTICPGASITLTTSRHAGNPVNFQWRKNGVNLPGATGGSYTVNNATAADAGSYDVVVSNGCGTEISTPATLNIHTTSINPTSQNFFASGSNGIVNVTSTGSCNWTATSNASWITLTSGASGTAPGAVGFTVAANAGPSQRTGTITIAGLTFTVTQDGTVPPANSIQFSQSTYSTSEGAGSSIITVTRSGNLSAPATVEYATTDGSATDRGDYNTTIGRLRFGAGESSKNFSVLLTDDAYSEGSETFNLTLSNPTGGPALGSVSTAAFTITDNDAVTSSSNPIDATSFFVHRQYVDFFSREPDASGLAFWMGNIDSCGGNTGCREVKRIDTSAAFFLSIEFQETGFLVHRLYRASFNQLTRYREFIRDSQEIGRGVVVNAPGWEALLESNKAAFVSEFVARSDFQSLYAGLTNAQYVDTLNTNTGSSLSQAERDALVAGLNGGGETRATALRKIAEDADFRVRETSPAFVLLQYFGYLRRNPDDAPEPGLNFNGYNFWLGKLNSFGGDYRAAEMVKAFITSTEYRQRFGQP